MKQTLNCPDTLQIIPYQLHFQKPARTSRSVLYLRKTYLIKVSKRNVPEISGWGEVAPLDGLSPEDETFHQQLNKVSNREVPLDSLQEFLRFPSFRFGMEAAQLDFDQGGQRHWFPGPFMLGEKSIPINGLIWMGDKAYMFHQIRNKLSEGYSCLKLKIGGIDFKEELDLLRFIRKQFPPDILELRLDANGSFHPDQAEDRLKQLSTFVIHSIEQPIATENWDTMASLCEKNIIPIALDEELIGFKSLKGKKYLLNTIRPQYLIFKPSLIGGLKETEEYIDLCREMHINWWITSALESNVGLNILAQFCDHLNVNRVQGLGTGKLFKNNIKSPLREENGKIYSAKSGEWEKMAGLL